MIHTVYILYSVTLDRYYVGLTSNLEDRLKRHNEGKNKHTKSGIPWKLMYQESFDTRSEAMVKEKKIKSSVNREELLRYIRSHANEMNV